MNNKRNYTDLSEVNLNTRYNLRSKFRISTDVIKISDFSTLEKCNIHEIFKKFNNRFFWGLLAEVKLEFSMRLKSSAGVCQYWRKSKVCCIRLSSPLLSLRPHSDLVDTLLHEMIHAYLFVTNTRDSSSHGPKFRKHMDRINNETGTNITVYHNFHSEVKLYQQHWWRCNGPCQKWAPFFGMVKRSMNKAPGPSDSWWRSHCIKCGGRYTKIREPKYITDVKRIKKDKDDFLSCPLCDKQLSRGSLNEHLEICGDLERLFSESQFFIDDDYGSVNSEPNNNTQPCPICGLDVTCDLTVHITECLHNCGIVNMLNEPITPLNNNNILSTRNNNETGRQSDYSSNSCPVCDTKVKGDMKTHLEGGCLNASGIFDSLDVPFDVNDRDEPTAAANISSPQYIYSQKTDSNNAVCCKLTDTCPICTVYVKGDIKTHVDECLSNSGLFDDSD